jgi:hypothetical protein
MLYTFGAAPIFFVFLLLPGFENRIIIFVLFGLSILTGLQISRLASNRSGVIQLSAVLLLLLLIPTPYFLTLETPIYSTAITESIQLTLNFSSHFPNRYLVVYPLNLYLVIVDPYAEHFRSVGYLSTGASQAISPGRGLNFVLTLPPGELANNQFQSIRYADAWNQTDRVYASGGVVAYYS